MILLVILLPTLVLLLCLVRGATFAARFPTRWWLWRLAFVPAVCFGLAGYVMAMPAPLPLDYHPAIHGNPGRLDFIAIVIYGLALPLAYLAIALPLSLGYAFWKRAR